MRFQGNYHTHSTLCDGKSTLRENAEEALRLGLVSLGFSGHMDADVHMDFPQYLSEVRSLQREYAGRLEILCGVELDNLYDPRYAEGTDYVIGSTHFLDVEYERPLSVDDTPEDMAFLLEQFYGGDALKLCRDYYRIEAGICDRIPCTFIGHFDLVTKFNHLLHFVDETDSRYLAPAKEAMEALVRKGLPFEINTRQAHRGKLFPGGELLKHLRSLGGEILLSSDAHHCSELVKGFDAAAEAAREAGFDHINYLAVRDGKTVFVPQGI